IETLVEVINREPPRPRSLNPRVVRDLETIAMKSLEKEPARRYGSAEAFADDLERWLHGETILARPSTPVERGWKWVRRHPAVAGLSLALLVVLLSAIGALSWQLHETDLARLSESRRADSEAAANIAAQDARAAQAIEARKANAALDRAQANLAL